jgi:hypothetical protein
MLLDEHPKRGERSNGHEVEGQKVRPAHRQCFEQRVDFRDRLDGHQKAFGCGQFATRDESGLGLASLISEQPAQLAIAPAVPETPVLLAAAFR